MLFTKREDRPVKNTVHGLEGVTNMKKYLSTLLLVACVFGLTVWCSKRRVQLATRILETETSLMFGLVSTEMSEDAHASIADRDEDYMDQLESALKEYYSIKIDGDVSAKGVESGKITLMLLEHQQRRLVLLRKIRF